MLAICPALPDIEPVQSGFGPIAEACAELGVTSLTVFAFSTENWHRPNAEVGLLMDLMRRVMRTEIDYLHKRRASKGDWRARAVC